PRTRPPARPRAQDRPPGTPRPAPPGPAPARRAAPPIPRPPPSPSSRSARTPGIGPPPEPDREHNLDGGSEPRPPAAGGRPPEPPMRAVPAQSGQGTRRTNGRHRPRRRYSSAGTAAPAAAQPAGAPAARGWRSAYRAISAAPSSGSGKQASAWNRRSPTSTDARGRTRRFRYQSARSPNPEQTTYAPEAGSCSTTSTTVRSTLPERRATC